MAEELKLPDGFKKTDSGIVWAGTVDGKPVELPIEKLTGAVSMGLSYENNNRQLKAAQQKLMADETTYNEYLNLKKHLDSNPRAAQAVAQALRDPDAAVSRGVQAQPEGDDDAESDTNLNGSSKVILAEIDSLKASNREMAVRLNRRDAADADRDSTNAVQHELLDYPWLKSADGTLNKKGELALQQVSDHLERTPGASTIQVVAQAATAIKSAMEEDQVNELNVQNSRQALRTVAPTQGTPFVTSKKEMKPGEGKKALESGELFKQSIAAAAEFFPDVPMQKELKKYGL